MATLPVLKLSPEEIAIIAMIRRNSFQEIMVQVQDSIIISVNQILKFRRNKKGGGLISGHVKTGPVNLALLTVEETGVIRKIREKPYQQIGIQIKNSVIECINQTIKFRNKGGSPSVDDLN